MSVDILGTSWDQCRSMVQYSFTSTETRRLVRRDSPGRPPRLSHSSWTMNSGLPTRNPSNKIMGSNLTRWAKWRLQNVTQAGSTIMQTAKYGDRQTDRQTGRQTDRQTDRQMNWLTQKQTDRLVIVSNRNTQSQVTVFLLLLLFSIIINQLCNK